MLNLFDEQFPNRDHWNINSVWPTYNSPVWDKDTSLTDKIVTMSLAQETADFSSPESFYWFQFKGWEDLTSIKKIKCPYTAYVREDDSTSDIY